MDVYVYSVLEVQTLGSVCALPDLIGSEVIFEKKKFTLLKSGSLGIFDTLQTFF